MTQPLRDKIGAGMITEVTAGDEAAFAAVVDRHRREPGGTEYRAAVGAGRAGRGRTSRHPPATGTVCGVHPTDRRNP
jgi:hypothetical protein